MTEGYEFHATGFFDGTFPYSLRTACAQPAPPSMSETSSTLWLLLSDAQPSQQSPKHFDISADRVPEVKRNEYLLRDFCIARELPVKQYGEGPDIRFATTKYGREASLMPLFSQLKIRSLELIAPASTTPFSQSKGIKRKAQVAPAVAPAVAETFTESIAGSVEMTVADTSSPSSREVWKSLPTEKGTYYQPTPYFKLFLEQQTTYKTAAQQALEMQAVLSPGSSKKA